jgi:hypothetical protein
MEIIVGAVIEWQDFEEGKTELRLERILRVRKAANQVVTIAIDEENKEWPIKRSYAEIVDAIAVERARVLENEIFPDLSRADTDIKPAHRSRRDNLRALLAPLLDDENDDYLLDSQARGRIISELAAIKGEISATKATIYKQYRRYLQSGFNPNSFLPDFKRCGGPGKRRVAGRRDMPKPGRLSALGKVAGEAIGVRVTAEVERKFERGIKYFYKDGLTLPDAYQKTLGEFFYDKRLIVDGKRETTLPPTEKLPTFRQFRYWYETVFRDRDPVKESKRREGERNYNLKYRETTGDPTALAFGPGSLYQIDATIADIPLVSSLNPLWIIGRPVTYACMDVFSHAGAGLCATLEGPSWLGAMLALDVVIDNKVSFCAEFGITIEAEEWPINGFPQSICADRGEFEGFNATNLVNGLHIRVDNTAPYRADWKSVVERQFGLLNQRCVNFLPGRVRKRARGDPDSRLGAMLTLNDFRQCLILYMLDYNKNFYLEDYRKDEFMIAEEVERYPLDIWRWGVRNRGKCFNAKSRDEIRLNLLPRKTVSITGSGIHFAEQLYYTCERALRENWFGRANVRKDWTMEVAFDPRTTDVIYLISDRGTRIEPCHLTQASRHFKSLDLHEIKDYFERERQAKEAAESRRRQSRATFHDKQDEIIDRATQRKEEALLAAGDISKSVRVGNVKKNRAEERERERATGAWKLGQTDALAAEETPQEEASPDIENELSYAAPSNLKLLQEQREDRWKGVVTNE